MVFCCKQLIKTKFFTDWVHLCTLLVALRWVRVSCTGQWCPSSTTLPSRGTCHPAPAAAANFLVSALGTTSLASHVLGLPERLENSALESKGATVWVRTPHPQCCLQIQRPVGALKHFAFGDNPFFLACHFYILFGKWTPFTERILRSYCMMGLGKTRFCFEAGSTYHNHVFLRFLLFYRKENAHCKESDFSDSDYRH